MANDNHPFRGSNVRIELEPDLPAPLAYPAQGYQQYLLHEHAKQREDITPPEWARKLLDKDEWLQRQLDEKQPWIPSLRPLIITFFVLFLWSYYLAIVIPWPRLNGMVPSTFVVIGASIILLWYRRNRRVIKLRAAYQAAGSKWVANPAKREEVLANNYECPRCMRAAAIVALDDAAERRENECRDAIRHEQEVVTKKRSSLLIHLATLRTYPLIDAALKDEAEIAALQQQEIDLIARHKTLDDLYTPLMGEIREMANALEGALVPEATLAMVTLAETRRVALAEKFRTLRFYAENPLKIPTRLPSAEEAEAPVQATAPARTAGKH